MTDPNPSQSSPPVPRAGPGGALGCLVGTAATFWGGLLVLAVVSLAAFIFLPRLLQGPLELGGRLDAVELQPLVNAEKPVGLGDLEGKVAVINFWGTWCPPCLMELPHIVELEKKFRGRDGFVLLAVSCGRGEREDLDKLRQNTAALFASRDIDMPAYADANFVTRRAFDKLRRFSGYPTTLLLDRRGEVREVWVGFDPKMPKDLERLVEKLLAEGQ